MAPSRIDPRVDVIIDNYNYGRYIARAIESALGQSHEDVSVIVVDDGSTDGSRGVIESYGERITAVLKANGGQASAFNAGFAHSEGDVVIFLDADDVLLPDTAARVARVFEDNPRAAKVQYRLAVIDAEGRRTGTVKPASHLPMPCGDLRREEVNFPFDLTWMATSGNAYARVALKQILPVPETEFATSADWYLRHLVALVGPILSCDWVGAEYRVHGANSYEPAAARLDLDHVRASIRYAEATRKELVRLSDQLGIERPAEILAVSDVANRLVSFRLERAHHPLSDDRLCRLGVHGWRASRRRFDVTPLMRASFAAWFTAMLVAPRSIARWLAELFFFPERRAPVNHWLGRMHRSAQQP